MERFGKTRLRRGFTLAEVLIVVAILAILLAFAAPVLIHAFVRMHLHALDNSACSIFAAAQNSMTAMVGNGELEGFAPDAPKISFKPSDFDETLPADYNTRANLRWLDSKSTDSRQLDALKQLLPGGSIESKLAEHRYIVEYNCVTGAVYAVWYSDQEAFEAPLPYETFGEWDRDFDKRAEKSPLVGYYGGSGVDYARVGQMPVPKLTLTNAEELRLHIEMPASSSGASGGSGTFDPGTIGLTVTVKGETSGESATLIDKSANVLLNQSSTADLMLDTLKKYDDAVDFVGHTTGADWKTGKQFKDWVAGTDLLPGEDITVTVTTYYAGTDGKLYLSQSASVSGNSLFANISDDGATAEVAYGRHLQNLRAQDLYAPGDPDFEFESGESVGVTKAVQTQAIDFAEPAPNTPGDPAADPIYYWASTYENTGDPAYRAFVPINKRVDYDGQSLPIRRLYSVSAGGLFGAVADGAEPVKWDNIVLIDTRVNATESHVGALAGEVTDAHITNCQVYLEKNAVSYDPDHPEASIEPQLKTTKSRGSIGGLVGSVRGANNSITDSFAATVISGGTGVSGLVGSMYGGSTLTIDHSYAACHLTATSSGVSPTVCGLVEVGGDDANLTVTNCYAAGVITGGYLVSGLAFKSPVDAKNSIVTINDSYAAVRYGALREYAGIFGTVRKDDTNVYGDHVYYVAQSGINYREPNFGTKLSAKELSEMLATGAPGATGNTLNNIDTAGNPIWYHLPAEKAGTAGAPDVANPTYATFPYNQTKETAELSTPYPYPQLLMRDANGNPIKNTDGKTLPMLHYGDWLESEEAGALLVYYEAYKNGAATTYGFYALGLAEDGAVTSLLNTLHKDGDTDGDTVIDDGYLLVSPAELPATTEYKIDGTAYSDTAPAPAGDPLAKVTDDPLTAALAAQDGFAEYKNVYTFHTDDTPRNYYHTLELNGQTFYYNTHFACEAYTVPAGATAPTLTGGTQLAKPGAGGKGTTDPAGPDPYANCVVVRSPRQLAFMAVYTNGTGVDTGITSAAQGWTWRQLLNIDYSAYTANAIKAGGASTGGTGNVGTENNPQHPAALGGSGSYNGNGHSIQKLFLGDRTGDTNVGLFGTVSGSATVQDLKLDTVTVNSTGTDATGALVGLASGSATIKNCTVVDGLVNATSANNTGALVGSAAGSTTITGCGAYVSNDTTNYTAHSITGGATVGGLIGMVGSSTTVNNCYAAVKVSGTTNVGGFAGQINGSKEMKDCYAGGHASGYLTTGTSYINVTATGDNGRAGGFVGNLMNYVQKKDNDGNLTFDKISSFNLTGTLYSTCSVSGKYTGLFAANVADCTVEYKDDPVAKAGTPIAKTLKDATVYGIGVAFNTANTPQRTAPTNIDEETQYFAHVSKILTSANAKAEPYYNTPQTEYPYATGLPTHHGDWPAFEGAFYWELETTKENRDGVYHYSGLAALGDAVFDMGSDLCTDHHAEDKILDNTITNWGYGLFSNAADAPGKTTLTMLTEKAGGLGGVDSSDAANRATATDAFKAIYPVSNVVMVKPAAQTDDDFYDSLELTANSSRYFELNRRFADAIDVVYTRKTSSPTNMGKGTATEENPDWTPYYIRTVQQLDCIPDGDGAYYVQTHDLYGAAYKNADGTPLYDSELTYFSGSYDGRLYRILELDMRGGLFGQLNGANPVLRNIILYSPSGNAKITPCKMSTTGDNTYTGGLAACTSSGTVSTLSNCVVAGYTITVGEGCRAGGLIGDSGGAATIENCAAVNTITGTNTGAYFYAGGLVGTRRTASNATLSFTNCYAGGSIDYAGTYNYKTKVGGVSGIVGPRSSRTSVVATNVYSYVKMSGKLSGADWDHMIEGFAGIATGRTTVEDDPDSFTNCYYWASGLPAGETAQDPASDGIHPCGLSGLAGLERAAFGGDAAHTFVPDTVDTHVENTRLKNGLTDKNETNPADPYPFPAVVRELNADGEATGEYVHYGEWPLEFLVAYYEKYTDDQYGFYALEQAADGTVTPLINTLKTDDSVAVTDGYAILYNTTPTNNTFKLNDGTTAYTLSGSAVKIGPATYTMYIPPFTELWKDAKEAAKAEDASYYQKLTMANGQVLLFNPLFACEAVNGRTTATAGALPAEAVAKPDLREAGETANKKYEGHIIIRTARQLANVGEMTAPDGNASTAYQQKAYDQLLGINYAKYERENSSSTGLDKDGFLIGKTNTNPQTPLLLSSGSYNGHGYAIRTLYTGKVTVESEDAIYGGLIGRAGPSSKLERITLINTKTYFGNAEYLHPLYFGALAGRTENAMVEDCGVYVEADTNTSYATAAAAYKLWDVYNDAKNHTLYRDNAYQDYAGGLIGRIEGGSVSRSYAAVNVEGVQRVGGFAGSMQGCTITDCYVGGYTVDGKYDPAQPGPNVWTDRMTRETDEQPPHVGGFAGELTGNVTFAKNSVSYTTASVGTTMLPEGSSQTYNVGLFIGYGGQYVKKEAVTDPADKAAVLYATGLGYQATAPVRAEYKPLEPVDEKAYLTDPDPFAAKAAGFVTVPYDTALKGAAYPYQTNLTAHHGDWPKFTMSGLMYLEYTIDPADPAAEPTFKYHYIAADSNGKTYDKYVEVGADGNAVETTANVFANDTPDGKSVTGLYATFINTAEGNTPPTPLTTGNVPAAVDTAVKARLATMMPGFDFNLYACQIYDKGTYRGVELAGGKIGYFNLAFADALSMEENTIKALGSESSPFIVRTVRQLQDTSRVNISDTTTHLYYKQTHDIVPVPDGAPTQWRLDNSYNAPSLINGTYYGGGYRVLDVNVTSTSAAGLFYRVKDSTVYDLVLYSPTGAGTIKVTYNNSSFHAGGITADLEQSTLNGCVAAGYTVSGYIAGGLVGQATGKCAIVNCSATTKLAGYASVGGLVGGTGYSNTDVLTVTNSYAGGTVTAMNYNAGEIDGLAGGYENHVVFKNVYSYLDMSIAPNGVSTYGIGNGTVDPDSQLCAYWAGGVPRSFTPSTSSMQTAKAMAFEDLKTATRSLFSSYKANEVYAPVTDDRAAGLGNQVAPDPVDDFTAFPFAALVQQQSNKRVHYGELPEPRMAAAFYWEKEGDAYNFELTGIDSFGQTRTLTLPEHKHDGNAITEWGYGIIKPSADSGVVTASNAPSSSSAEDALVKALRDALGLPDLAAANVTLWSGPDVHAETDKKADTVTVSIEGSSYGGTDKTYTVNRAFAAAIQEKDSTPELGSQKLPYQIRTLGQLKNINKAEGLYFEQTHDLNVEAHNKASSTKYTHTPLQLANGGYDGGGYRILNMDITNRTDDAGLFCKLGSDTGTPAKVVLQNIVLYAPDGSGQISASTDEKAAGGLVAAVLQTADVTIDNCVVAGYTINSSVRNAAGGLVGSVYGLLTVKNSQTVVDLTYQNGKSTAGDVGAGPGLGGLVGYVYSETNADYGYGHTQVTITNSYAGGRLVKSSSTGVVDKLVDYAGGLIGYVARIKSTTAQVQITNSYAYMTGTKYGISYDESNRNVTVTNCAYLKTSNDQTGKGDAMETNDTLAEWASKVTDGGASVFGTADETYAPTKAIEHYAKGKGLEANDGSAEYPAYPFGAVVNDPLNGGNPVHYGTWPLYRAAGVIYWEKYVGGSYGFELVGYGSFGKTLTQSLPEGGPDIADWGYGIFDTGAEESGSWAVTLSSASIAHPESPSNDVAAGVAAALNKALHLKEGTLQSGTTVTLWKGMDLSNYTAHFNNDDKTACKVFVSVDKPSLGIDKYKTYDLYLAFAAAIQESTDSSYVGGMLGSNADNPLLIRTVDQLRNINNAYSSRNGNGLYFKQARDLDLNGIAYEPIWLNGGGYDGGGYRILNLNVTSSDNAGLFGWVGYTEQNRSTVSRRVALKNIILYAPGGDGRIESISAAGGLVGYIYDRAQVTIENCVVAGYTISSAGDLAGGLVGDASCCKLTVRNSQAVVDLVYHESPPSSYSEGFGLGGLVGCVYYNSYSSSADSAALTVTNSYAGGRVVYVDSSTNTNLPVETTPNYAGGLVGHVSSSGESDPSKVYMQVDIDHSYAYMTGTKYGISPDAPGSVGAQVNVTNCAYLKTSTDQTQSGNTVDVAAKETINDLATWTKTLTDSDGNVVFSTAGETYAPTKVIDEFVNSSDGLAPYGTPYPFGAIVTDGGQAVHYGTWPTVTKFISAPPVEDGPGIIELTCICTEKCTADSICETCPVCSADYTKCQATDPAGDEPSGDEPGEGEPTPEPEPTPAPETTPEPEATPEPETTPEPEATPEPETTPEPEATPEPETTPEPTPAPAGDETPEPTPMPAEAAPGEGGGPE